MLIKKWMVNQLISVIMISLIFLSFQFKLSESSSLNDAPKLTNNSDEAFLFKTKVGATGNGDSAINLFQNHINELFHSFHFNQWNSLRFEVFTKAYKGYLVMKSEGMISNPRFLTIIDFELSANCRRMWVFDLYKRKLVIHDLVSHGRNSGEEYANSFSNKAESFKSSLGFFVTGSNYLGKNNYSLRLHGVEEGFNDNAFERGIVMHGADYVCKKYIVRNKRLGRSQGCPAVPQKINKWLINTIEGGSCLFIYYPENNYLKRSEILNSDIQLKDFINL